MDSQRMFRPPRQFVSDDDVSKALGYLNLGFYDEDSHPEAVAKLKVNKAQNDLEKIMGQVYGQKEGTAEARKAARDCDERVCAARDNLAEAQFELDAHKARIRSAQAIHETWRTQSSNTRSAHSVR